jgi:hypothetical protein
VDIFNTSNGSWSTATLTNARYQASAVSLGNKFIVAGGTSGSGFPTPSVEIYTVTNTGIVESGGHRMLSLFPNPSSGNISIEMSSEKEPIVRIELIDGMGRCVYLDNTTRQTGQRIQISLDSILPGMYQLKTTSSNGNVSVGRLIRQ